MFSLAARLFSVAISRLRTIRNRSEPPDLEDAATRDLPSISVRRVRGPEEKDYSCGSTHAQHLPRPSAKSAHHARTGQTSLSEVRCSAWVLRRVGVLLFVELHQEGQESMR